MTVRQSFVSIERARILPGFRLVVANPRRSPGLWALAARAIVELKGIPYTAVSADKGNPPEPELFDWTGQTSIPVAMYEGERPRHRWNEILLLAERLSPSPPLIPASEPDRVAMFGICSELCDEDGFGWCFRLFVFDEIEARGAHDRISHLRNKYKLHRTAASAKDRLAAIMAYLDELLQAQQKRGLKYLVGPSVTAADIFWVAFAAGFAPFLIEKLPLEGPLRGILQSDPAEISHLLTPRHVSHLTYIYKQYFPRDLVLVPAP